MRRLFSSLLQVLGILLVGLFVGFRLGPSMLDPFFFIPFTCFSAILAGPILTEVSRRNKGSIAVQVRLAVTRACVCMSLILIVSLLSLNLMPWGGEWLLPEWTTVIDATLLSVTGTTAVAAVMALLLSRLTPGAAKWIFRALVICGLLIYRGGPGVWSNYGVEMVLKYGLSTVAVILAAGLALFSAGLLRMLGRQHITTGNNLQPAAD